MDRLDVPVTFEARERALRRRILALEDEIIELTIEREAMRELILEQAEALQVSEPDDDVVDTPS